MAVAAAALAGGSERDASAAAAPSRLGDTGLFVAGSVDQVRAGNLPFAPQYPLWSDGASKRRWVRLPAGRHIDAVRPDAWEFPRGTRFWKEFAVGGRRVETRTIERLGDGSWRYATYVWNAEGSEATLAPAAGLPAGVEVGGGRRHVVPGEVDCRACHEGRPMPILGFSALQLSPDRDPGAAHAEPVPAAGVDLRELVARGLVRGLPARLVTSPPRIPAATPIARAALGYLHANCGNCHNDEGPLAVVGLSLAQEIGRPEGAAAVLESALLPSHFRLPAVAGETFRVLPGRPDLSAVALRMRARDPLTQMPPLGTGVVDDQGLALVERWIRETRDLRETNQAGAPRAGAHPATENKEDTTP